MQTNAIYTEALERGRWAATSPPCGRTANSINFSNRIKSQSCSTHFGFSAPAKMPKFVPRQRKHKNKLKETNPIPQQDTNVAELAPVSKLEKEEKRRKYREELLAQQPRISGKKQKRLDKYIVRSILSMCVSHFLRH